MVHHRLVVVVVVVDDDEPPGAVVGAYPAAVVAAAAAAAGVRRDWECEPNLGFESELWLDQRPGFEDRRMQQPQPALAFVWNQIQPRDWWL